ncbi:hypothetical protein CBER1_01490 [Cercospora berteroae]|uniref:Uncharacterized protein n=1 Tax=Cercospora berteroae TaxID=357750 RepID=A0A2S6C5Y6_9PEZI|nr:hypothetical protein CBER1_01490 [Cercospora berteroae]
MKQFALITATLAALLPSAFADFDIYYSTFAEGISQTSDTGFTIFDGEPDCNDVFNNQMWGSFGDVSGSKVGFRCSGSGCTPSRDTNPENIDVLEMNFGDGGHYTMYKDRDYALVDLDGNQVGTCEPFPGDDYLCAQAVALGNPNYTGDRKIKCRTDFTAQDILDA